MTHGLFLFLDSIYAVPSGWPQRGHDYDQWNKTWLGVHFLPRIGTNPIRSLTPVENRGLVFVDQYANGVKLHSPASRSARWESDRPTIEPQGGSTGSLLSSLDIKKNAVNVDRFKRNSAVVKEV